MSPSAASGRKALRTLGLLIGLVGFGLTPGLAHSTLVGIPSEGAAPFSQSYADGESSSCVVGTACSKPADSLPAITALSARSDGDVGTLSGARCQRATPSFLGTFPGLAAPACRSD